MPPLSAGLLLYRRRPEGVEVLLVHPGGPFWARRDEGAWSVPKGEHAATEDPLVAARREFEEELGVSAPTIPDPVPLGELRQPGGKRVRVWAAEGDLDVTAVRSNTFTTEWPPRSGSMREFPEVDRAEWFPPDVARVKLLRGQVGFVDRLVELLDGEAPSSVAP